MSGYEFARAAMGNLRFFEGSVPENKEEFKNSCAAEVVGNGDVFGRILEYLLPEIKAPLTGKKDIRSYYSRIEETFLAAFAYKCPVVDICRGLFDCEDQLCEDFKSINLQAEYKKATDCAGVRSFIDFAERSELWYDYEMIIDLYKMYKELAQHHSMCCGDRVQIPWMLVCSNECRWSQIIFLENPEQFDIDSRSVSWASMEPLIHTHLAEHGFPEKGSPFWDQITMNTSYYAYLIMLANIDNVPDTVGRNKGEFAAYIWGRRRFESETSWYNFCRRTDEEAVSFILDNLAFGAWTRDEVCGRRTAEILLHNDAICDKIVGHRFFSVLNCSCLEDHEPTDYEIWDIVSHDLPPEPEPVPVVPDDVARRKLGKLCAENIAELWM